jgi:hypothetical protein
VKGRAECVVFGTSAVWFDFEKSNAENRYDNRTLQPSRRFAFDSLQLSLEIIKKTGDFELLTSAHHYRQLTGELQENSDCSRVMLRDFDFSTISNPLYFVTLQGCM